MYLFFDTETTGLPKKWGEKMQNVDNWPRVIQLAFILTDNNFNIINEYCELIKPDGWEIPSQKFWIDNGYSTEENMKKGVKIEDALKAFIIDLESSEYLLAHNIAFDHPVLGAEMIRKNISTKSRPEKICTMKSTTGFMNLPRMKWPKLEELHERLFNCNFDNAHDALADVKATIRCFKYLKENELIMNWTI